MTREECVAFVRQAISHAMARDGSSGALLMLAIRVSYEVARDCSSLSGSSSSILYRCVCVRVSVCMCVSCPMVSGADDVALVSFLWFTSKRGGECASSSHCGDP